MRHRRKSRLSRRKKTKTRGNEPRTARKQVSLQPRGCSLERLLNAKELEAALQIDVKTIYLYATKKIIPHVRIVTNVRFREKDIANWIERHTYRPRTMRKRARHKYL